jgi:hypothetical protein
VYRSSIGRINAIVELCLKMVAVKDAHPG